MERERERELTAVTAALFASASAQQVRRSMAMSERLIQQQQAKHEWRTAQGKAERERERAAHRTSQGERKSTYDFCFTWLRKMLQC